MHTIRFTGVLFAASLFCTGILGCASGGDAGGTTQAGESPAAAGSGRVAVVAPEQPEGEQPARRPRRRAFEDDAFRAAGPRENVTIFTQLDWPAPNTVRLGSGAPGPDYWQQRCDYMIDATLDADARRVSASARIVYTNNSPSALDFAWINLEQNLFDEDSIGARLTRGPGARFGNRDGFSGGYEIEFVGDARVSGADGEAASADELALNVYDTLGRLELPAPIPPGGTLEFTIRWSFNIPPYGSDRLGIEEVDQGEVFELAQWFPNMCVYDDRYGWNTLPYLGAGEFYTNFGDYEVTITAPRSHVVVATGVLQNPDEVFTTEQAALFARAHESDETVVIVPEREDGVPPERPAGDGPLAWKFRAENVRTFAFASSDAFIIDAASLLREETGERVLVQSAYPREGAKLWSKSTQMLKTAIEGYNRRWVDYPYPVATNVNGIVGGMEYPMIIFCSDRRSERGLYGVTTHEIGHNWFPMMISSDERRHAWMDEGFNTFINHYSDEDWFGQEPERGPGMFFARGMLSPNQQPIVTAPDQIVGSRLGMLAYSKVAIGLVLLREEILGPDRFDPAFNEYMERWAFKSPRPEDFFRTMEDAAGDDLSWFWRGWFYESATLDQSIETVEPMGSPRPPRGRRDAPQEETAGSAPQRMRVSFLNRGELVMPLDYRVTFDDGTTEEGRVPVQAWFTSNRWAQTIETGGREISKIEIDPERAFPDIDYRNNVWERPAAASPEGAGESGDVGGGGVGR